MIECGRSWLRCLSREKLRGEGERERGREPRRNDATCTAVGRSIGRLLAGAVKSAAPGMFYVGQLRRLSLFICIAALARVNR